MIQTYPNHIDQYQVIGFETVIGWHGYIRVTPSCRITSIPTEDRTASIPHENRTVTIPYENRTVMITCQ